MPEQSTINITCRSVAARNNNHQNIYLQTTYPLIGHIIVVIISRDIYLLSKYLYRESTQFDFIYRACRTHIFFVCNVRVEVFVFVRVAQNCTENLD